MMRQMKHYKWTALCLVLLLTPVSYTHLDVYKRQVWDKPAYACLATRVQPGMRITAENLARIERAEQALFTLGFRDFRVRQRGDTALLQLPQAQLPRALEQRKVLLQALRTEFSAAGLDLEARDE